MDGVGGGEVYCLQYGKCFFLTVYFTGVVIIVVVIVVVVIVVIVVCMSSCLARG